MRHIEWRRMRQDRRINLGFFPGGGSSPLYADTGKWFTRANFADSDKALGLVC
jgi:hypothetical protein